MPEPTDAYPSSAQGRGQTPCRQNFHHSGCCERGPGPFCDQGRGQPPDGSNSSAVRTASPGRSQAQDAAILMVQRMVGYVPVGTRDLLNVLAHPDCIAATRAFLDATDDASRQTATSCDEAVRDA